MGLTEASAFKDGKIVNDDVNASAAIAGSKISPDFGSQNITTTGNIAGGQNINLFGTVPHIIFNDTNDNPDYKILNRNGSFNFEEALNSTILLSLTTSQATITQNLNLNSQLKLFDDDNSHSIGFKAPATVTSNVLFTLPATDAAFSGYALISDGAGTLSWGVAGGARGNGNNQIFWENDQTVTGNYTITSGKNAGSFGSITIASNVSVTIGSGQTWSIV